MGVKLNPFTGKLDVVDSPSGDFNELELNAGTASEPSIAFAGDTNTGIYSPGADQVAISTNGTERMRITSDGKLGLGTSAPSKKFEIANGDVRLSDGYTISWGDDAWRIFRNTTELRFDANGALALMIDSSRRVGIGTTSPQVNLDIAPASSSATLRVHARTDTSAVPAIELQRGTATTWGADVYGDYRIKNDTAELIFEYGQSGSTTERARIDSYGKLLVGTSGSASIGDSQYAKLQVRGNTISDTGIFSLQRASAPSSSGDAIGSFFFTDNSGNEYASIKSQADATPGTDDYPGRLVFSTTADGASSPTERMRISENGSINVNYNASHSSTNTSFGAHNSTSTGIGCLLVNSNGSYAATGYGIFGINAIRSASSAYTFAGFYSNNATDREFHFRGDGEGYCDGSWTGGGADYAEYFEWSDSNPNAEDRRGISVVLDGDKIRPAVVGEDPIGVISGNPSVVGDAAWNKWSGKYLRDDFGTYIQEDYEVEDENGNTVIQQRRKLNPAYDPDVEYTSREDRPEWDCVGLMGKLRLRKGQPTGSRWIKMRDISDSVEEWLVR